MPEVMDHVHIIDLHFVGQSGAIAAYLLLGKDGSAALIETGPSSGQEALVAGIRAAGVEPSAITRIVVTHIHLDHSGGTGTFVRDHAPRAHVWVHPLGLPHLVDPSKLIRSATRLYGETMDVLWGEIAPLAEAQVTALDDGQRLTLAGHELEVLFTPGHAAHHVALRHIQSNAIFAGDVAGVRVPGAAPINPPTVPPEFDLDLWVESIDRLLAFKPYALLLIHFGVYYDAEAHLHELKRRLHEWTNLVRDGLEAGRTPAELGAELQRRDAAAPGNEAEGIRRLDLIAGYAINASGIQRYLDKKAEQTANG